MEVRRLLVVGSRAWNAIADVVEICDIHEKSKELGRLQKTITLSCRGHQYETEFRKLGGALTLAAFKAVPYGLRMRAKCKVL